MTITLNAVEIKHERRIRLIFSRPLGGGAFGVAPIAYVITSDDALGISPGVSAAMIISENPASVELALDSPLVIGGRYTVGAVSVPGDDASTATASLPIRFGLNAPRRDVEPLQRNRDTILFGVDLVWDGDDYQESANGDLARIGGTPNVIKALHRGMESLGLPWDQSYGAKARRFVDSPSPSSGTLKGSITAQVLKDPRVKSVKVTITTDDEKTYLNVTPTLISGKELKQVSLAVSTG